MVKNTETSKKSNGKKIAAIICGVVAIAAIVAVVVFAINNQNNQNSNSNSSNNSNTSSNNSAADQKTAPDQSNNNAVADNGNTSNNGSSESSNSIVGVWKYYDPAFADQDINFTYTFNADGTGVYDAAGTILPFTYEINGQNIKITMQESTYSGDFNTTFEIVGDKLNIKDSGNTDTIYQRVK